MDAMSAFSQRVHAARLTKKEAAVADYILNNFSAVCYMSTGELGRNLGVSDATVIRTCRALGYTSFLELQEELRSQLTRDAENAQRIFSSPMERMQTSRSGDTRQGLHLKYSRLMMQNLDSVFHKNTEETLEQVVQLLSSCPRKYIVGQRPTASLAERFAFLLRMAVPGVRVSTQRVIMEDILDLCPEDCLFVIDFNQYSNTAMKVLSYGRSRGAKIVLLTDRPTAPFAGLADLLLVVDVDGISFFNSQVAAVFLLELLATLVADRNSEETERRLNVLNPYFDEHRLK